MSSIYEAKEEMYQIEAQLYPNHLAGGENAYLAKNTKEKTINVDAETDLWMVPMLDPSKAVKVNRVVSNNASRIEFIPIATGYRRQPVTVPPPYLIDAVLSKVFKRLLDEQTTVVKTGSTLLL